MQKDGQVHVASTPEPEVLANPTRRRFTAEYKARILRKVGECQGPGEVGALLRKEGLYSSLLSKWRRQSEAGALRELGRKRGRQPQLKVPELEKLRRENARLLRENHRLKAINELQKKISEILGIPQSDLPLDERDS